MNNYFLLNVLFLLGKPFPEVADAVHVELEDCRAAEQEIKRLKDVMGGDALADNDHIASTVSSLPGQLIV